MPLIFSSPHPALMLSWFPTAACKVNKLKEEGEGVWGSVRGWWNLIGFLETQIPLKTLTHPSTESSWTHEELTWIAVSSNNSLGTYNISNCYLQCRLILGAPESCYTVFCFCVCFCCFLYRCHHLWLYIKLRWVQRKIGEGRNGKPRRTWWPLC